MYELELDALEYIKNCPENTVPREIALVERAAGLRIFDAPIFAYSAADDPSFASFREAGVVGPHHMTPGDWLRGAKTVISVFLPFSEEVRVANRPNDGLPAPEWLHARIQGQELLSSLIVYLCGRMRAKGHKCMVPSEDARFTTSPHDAEEDSFTSNWSERHVAYASGHGTFGLSAGLITKSGMAGRFGSLVTDLYIEPTVKTYSDHLAYCMRCGACAERCPVGAISLESGKNHALCSDFIDSTRTPPVYYGCGKCQVGVPCEARPPLNV